MTRKRVRRTVVDQFSLRLYAESPKDVWIADALQPFGTGMLRAAIVEALYEGLQVLKRKGWSIGEKKDKDDKATEVPLRKPDGKVYNLEID